MKLAHIRDEEIVWIGKDEVTIQTAVNEYAVLDYCTRLAKVQDKVKDKVILIPRVYTNKPRTTGLGYKGILHQPDPEKKPDLLHGLIALRKMHMHAVESSGLTAADEMLYPENWRYLDDILSYVAIGALCQLFLVCIYIQFSACILTGKL